MVARKPGHQGELGVSRKTIVQGMPGRIRCTCGEYSCAFYFCTRGYGCSGHPAFPAPSLRGSLAPSISRRRNLPQNSGAPRCEIADAYLSRLISGTGALSLRRSRRHRTRVAYRPASRFDQRDEALDHFIEQRRLFEIKHVARLRKKRQDRCGKMSLQKETRLDTSVVLVASRRLNGRCDRSR